MSDKSKLSDAKERFRIAHDAESDQRIRMLEDLRFGRLGEQWPSEAIVSRGKDRPRLTINRIPSFARQIINDARQNKPSIKVKPADSGADPKTAETYTGLIRNIETTSNAEVAYDTALESAVYGGIGYFRIRTDYAYDDAFDLDLLIERIANPFTVYADPLSEAADASDWRFAFVTELMPRDAFKREYPDADPIEWSSDGDKHDELWHDEDTVRVAEEWLRERVQRTVVRLSSGDVIGADQYKRDIALFDAQGITVVGERETQSWKVTQRIMTAHEVLATNEWAGKLIPIVPVYGTEVNVEGRRYFVSLTREIMDAQRMYNYWRSTTTELVALAPKAPYIGPRGAFDADSRWSTVDRQSHPFLEYEGAVMPQRQPFDGVPAGALQEALSASDDMKGILGIYDASLGQRSNETSGRAILARQREGDVATFHYIDNLARAIRYAGRVLIDMIPSVYTGERIVRTLGEDGSAKNVPLMTADEHGNVVDLSRGKYDLVVESGPSYSTKRDEAAIVLTEMMRASPQAAPLMMDIVARNIDVPEADTLAKRFKALLPPPVLAAEQEAEGATVETLTQQLAQAQLQMQQMQQALQQMQAEQAAEMQKVQADREQAQAKLQLEREKAAAQIQLDREKFQAEMQLKTATATAGVQLKRLDMRQSAAIKARSEKSRSAGNTQASLRNGDPLDQVVNGAVESAVQEQTAQNRQSLAVLAQALQKMSEQQAQALSAVVQSANQPKELVRDENGRAIGVRPMGGT